MANFTKSVILALRVLAAVLLAANVSNGQSETEKCTSHDVLIKEITKIDNSNMLPPFDVNGTSVSVSIHIQRIQSLDVNANSLELFGDITETWTDKRLNFEFMQPCVTKIALVDKMMSTVWQPRLAFVESETIASHLNTALTILHMNGTILRNYQFHIKSPFRFDLSRFPNDRQFCSIAISSLEYNANQVILGWIEDGQHMPTETHAAEYRFENVSFTRRQMQALQIYDELVINLTFGRHSGWYVTHAYFPSFVLLAVSWVSFCLGRAITARAILGFGCLAVLILIYNFLLINTPKIPYLTSLDIWMNVCILLVFVSLLELALCAILQRKFATKFNLNEYENYDSDALTLFLPETRKKVHRKHYIPKTVDIIFAILYPLAAVGFVFLYHFYFVI